MPLDYCCKQLHCNTASVAWLKSLAVLSRLMSATTTTTATTMVAYSGNTLVDSFTMSRWHVDIFVVSLSRHVKMTFYFSIIENQKTWLKHDGTFNCVGFLLCLWFRSTPVAAEATMQIRQAWGKFLRLIHCHVPACTR